jgi:transposase-like protein
MKSRYFKSLTDLLRAFPTEKDCLLHYEQLRWPNGVVSPFDPTSKVYCYSNGTYRCKNTGKNFTVKTGSTIFHNTKIPLQEWFMAIWLISSHKKGISSCQLAKDVGVTQKTAWFMAQRIRESFDTETKHLLNGIVELDETFVGGKNKNRHYDKKVKNSQGRSFKDKTPVLGMLQRGGKLVCRVVENTSKKQLTPHILETIKRTAQLYTDEWSGYNKVGKLYARRIVDHSRHQYVNGDVSTNTIEGFWSILKRGFMGIYHWVSRKHLQKYVNEFVLRYNTRSLSNSERFNLVLANAGNNHITYKQLIGVNDIRVL